MRVALIALGGAWYLAGVAAEAVARRVVPEIFRP